MIIGIQRGLEGLKEKLEERGYKVYYDDEYYQPVDAYIFNKRFNIPDIDYGDDLEIRSSIEKIPCHPNKVYFLYLQQIKHR